MSSEILNMQFQIWRRRSSTGVRHYKSDLGAWYEEAVFDGRQKNDRQKHQDDGTCFSLMDASKWNLCWLNFLIERRSISHIHPHFADGRESAHSISRQVLERGKKRSPAVPFPLARRQAWPEHTSTFSSLLAIHIILSLCSLCKDSNFTMGPILAAHLLKDSDWKERKKGHMVQNGTKS